MFREMLRKKQALSLEKCKEILKTETRGVLSVMGENGYPYGMPMNHFYNEGDGCIYFHCGKTGHRLDALTRSSKVSFCVMDRGEARDGGWALTVRSVIVFGQVEIVDNPAAAADVCRQLCYQFTRDEDYIQREIQAFAHETLLLKLTPAHISGKWVVES